MHYAYSKRAEVTVPSLDECERGWQKQPVASGQLSVTRSVASGQYSVAGGDAAEDTTGRPKVVVVDFTAPRGEAPAGADRRALAEGG